MGNKKAGKEHIRKLTKIGSGGTYYVTLPKDLIKKFKWRERQKVVVRKYKGKNKFVIEDYEK